MRLRFFRDPATGLPHVYEHGVTEAEVASLLRRPGEERAGRNGAREALGQTLSGRYLRVIFVPDKQGDGIFVVTAFELQGKALQTYRRRKRR